MADPKTFKLTAPDGTKVEVQDETRRDALLARGYTEGGGSRSSGGEKKS